MSNPTENLSRITLYYRLALLMLFAIIASVILYGSTEQQLILRILILACSVTLAWLIWNLRRIIFNMLGGNITELQQQISHLGNGNFSAPSNIGTSNPYSIFGLLAETQSKLKRMDVERRQAEVAMTESEQRFHLAITAANDGLWDRYVGKDSVYYSPRWKAMLGYAEHELSNIYASWEGNLHPEDAHQVLATINNCITENQDRFQHEYRLRQKNGQYLWVLDRGMIQRDTQGNPLRFIGIQTDISAQKYVERMKNEFISTVSHELRTPLTSIHGSLKLIDAGVMGELPVKVHDMVKMANKNSLRLINLVNEILDMEKLMSGMMILQQAEVSLPKILAESVNLNNSYASSFGVRYIVAAQPSACVVLADPERLLQVLTNLLSNAAKFSPRGGVVNVRYLLTGTHARIEIEDRGQGIPLAFRSKIFGEFTQASNGNTRQQGGAGLGLNIAQKIVVKMNGEIGYHSEISKGTTFWFTVPLKPDESH